MSYIIDTTKIELSRNDIREIRLPEKLTPELSESVGILIGDGNLHAHKDDYRLVCSGDMRNDFLYFHNYIKPLFFKLFNKRGNIVKVKDSQECRFEIYSKGIVLFYHKIFGLPIGKKSAIKIPEFIATQEIMLIPLLRGIADTDFSLTFMKNHSGTNRYPVIHGGFADKLLVDKLITLLSKVGFRAKTYKILQYDKRTKNTYISYHIFLRGIENLEKWMKKIGFNNFKHLTKYLIWKKFGFCPPHTTLEERIKILNKVNFTI